MIYLIETTYYNKETKKVLDLLKIGYTEDSRKDIRFMAYKMHNPGFKLLYEIPNLSEDVEKRVQYKFRNLLYSEYGREWFYYSDDIINFFRDIDKIDLESLPKSPMSERRKYWKLNKLVKNVVYWVSIIPKESKRDYIEKIIEDLGSNLKNIQDILNYIEKDYGSESTLEYRKTIDNFMESIENLMKLQNGLKGYLMSHIDSVKSIKPEMQKMMNEFETKKLVKIPEGWDFLEVDDEYNVIVAREKKGA